MIDSNVECKKFRDNWMSNLQCKVSRAYHANQTTKLREKIQYREW